MSSAIRNRYELPTIRITVRPHRSELSVRFQCFRGSRELEAEDAPASALGILADLSVASYRYVELRLPDPIAQFLRRVMQPVLRRHEPLWLIVESSGHLAVVPWEQLIEPLFGVPLLRVPNFVADPAFLSGPLRLAVCLSSPISKTPFDVPAYAGALVRAVQRAVSTGTNLHVFADGEVYEAVKGAIPPSTDRHSVVIHNPEGAARFGSGDSDKTFSDEPGALKSPWLLWMQSELEGAVDAVHLVSPGYFRGERGALTFARSPVRNTDRQWAHFISAEEIAAFLPLVGAWCVMFSPPYENVWSIGPRVVAGSLAWQHPGPVLLHDLRLGSLGEHELEEAYRFLFDETYSAPPASPSVMMYVHPKRVAQYEGADWFDSPAATALAPDLEQAARPFLSRPPRGSTHGRGAQQPSWKQGADVQMGKLMLRLKGSDSVEGRGITTALAQLSSILGNGEEP